MRVLVVLCVLSIPTPLSIAHAEPCDDTLFEPIATPLHPFDLQRGGCIRRAMSLGISGQVLIDTPGFHGVIGGDMTFAFRWILGDANEIGARIGAGGTYAQTGVNKVFADRYGPLLLTAARSLASDASTRLAIVASAEVPYTRQNMDTVRSSGELDLALSAVLSANWHLHARMGAAGEATSSSGGDTHRIALRAGTDLVWHVRRSMSLSVGADAEAGWRHGFSTLLVKTGWQWRPPCSRFRLIVGVGAPVGGDEPTDGIVSVGASHDLE